MSVISKQGPLALVQIFSHTQQTRPPAKARQLAAGRYVIGGWRLAIARQPDARPINWCVFALGNLATAQLLQCGLSKPRAHGPVLHAPKKTRWERRHWGLPLSIFAVGFYWEAECSSNASPAQPQPAWPHAATPNPWHAAALATHLVRLCASPMQLHESVPI